VVRSYTAHMKRNLTVQLDDEVIRAAKVLAAKRGTSVSGMVAAELARLVAEDARYEEAWRRARKAMGDAAGRGGRHWDREELHGR
jgi:predicted transcriptional regulator